jgi:hypothetical protein
MNEILSAGVAKIVAVVSDPRWARTTDGIRRVWLWAGWLAFGALCLRLTLDFLTPLSAVAAFLTLVAFCFPGWVLLSLFWGGELATRRPELWLWGGWVGIAVCAWVAMIEGYLTGTAGGISVLALDLAAIVAWFMLSRRRGFAPIPIRPWRFGERVLWQLVSLWILAFVNHAYSSWGLLTEAGFTRYPGAFGADLLALVSRATMIAAGLPYSSPSFSGIAAPLESGAAFLPVIGRYWMDPSGPMTAWVIVTGIFLAIGFGGVVVSVLRMMISRFRFLVLTVFFLLFAYSFYWVFPAIRPDLIPTISAYGIGPLLAHQGLSPLLYRWILASPQTLLTLGLALLAVAWVRAMPRPASWPSYAGIGLAAGLLAGLDYQSGWLGIVAVGVWIGAVWIHYPHDRRNTGLGAVLFLIATVAALLPIWILGIHSPHPITRLQFTTGAGALLSAPARLLVLYGPILVLGIIGAMFAQRRFRGAAGLTFGVMIVLSLFLMFFIGTSGDPWFGQRVGAAVLLALLLLGLSRYSIDDLSSAGTGGWIVLVAVGLAIPTVLFDYHSVGRHADIDAAILIHPEDKAAANWSLKFLPPDAVVQSQPEYYCIRSGDSITAATMSWGTDLALRPMGAGPRRLATGLGDSLIESRTDQVLAMLSAKHPDSTSAHAVRLGIEYVYCGPNEMRTYPRLRARLSASPKLFEAVYETDSSGIYKVFLRQDLE